MNKHEAFKQWAVSKGIEIAGIAAHKFQGRGLGIIATKEHKAGETILKVPISALHTANTVPKSTKKALGPITVHGLLAADLSLNNDVDRSSWLAVLPTMKTFEESMPLTWPVFLQELLPTQAAQLLLNQKRKLDLDWTVVHKAFPDILESTFLYNWLLVNTRTFYYQPANASRKKTKRVNRDDCMALNPFADYFNHAPTGCVVTYSKAGYEITTKRTYGAGEEIYISYGHHSNDFLLTEYGFMVSDEDGGNEWDEVLLGEMILKRESEVGQDKEEKLRECGFWGKYALDKNGVCYRTQVAIRLLCLPINRWQRFVDGYEGEESDRVAAAKVLSELLEEYAEQVRGKLHAVAGLNIGQKHACEILNLRWNQILDILVSAISKIHE